MWHTIFITAHAATAGTALLAGCVAIAHATLLRTYLWSLVAMEAFLVLAIAAKWAAIGVAAQALFVAFAAVGLYMAWRTDQARRIQPTASTGPSGGYVAHVGFTLVALFDAFIVILVLDLGAPVWLVALAGVLIGPGGHLALHALHRRLVHAPRTGRLRSQGRAGNPRTPAAPEVRSASVFVSRSVCGTLRDESRASATARLLTRERAR